MSDGAVPEPSLMNTLSMPALITAFQFRLVMSAWRPCCRSTAHMEDSQADTADLLTLLLAVVINVMFLEEGPKAPMKITVIMSSLGNHEQSLKWPETASEGFLQHEPPGWPLCWGFEVGAGPEQLQQHPDAIL